MTIDAKKFEELAANYSACDISDCLLKLKVPGAGFLADILPLSTLRNTTPTTTSPKPLVLPLSTILFVPKSFSPPSPTTSSSSTTIPKESNIPPTTHWTDLPLPQTLTLISQPPTHHCAVVGDILATRLKVRGVRGIVVDGRIRDLVSMARLTTEEREGQNESQGFSVWSKGTSTVGTAAEAKAWASGVDVVVGDVVVRAGDIAFVDPNERGVVVIPQDKFEAVCDMLPGVKAADDAVVADVEAGVTVQEAFKRHRGT